MQQQIVKQFHLIINTPAKPLLSPTCQNCMITDKALTEDLKQFIMEDQSPMTTLSHQSTKCPPISNQQFNFEENLQTDIQIKSLAKPNNKKVVKQKNSHQRKDKFGNKIIKGNKKHKICFAPIIAQEFEIENWKQFNKKGINEVESCYCKII